MKETLLRHIWLGLAAAVLSAAAPAVDRSFGFGEVRFEENRGQTAPEARFIARARGQQIFLTNAGVAISPSRGGTIHMSFAGAAEPRWAGLYKASDTISYYVGSDPLKWVKNAAIYERVIWRDVYPGIDAVFYGQGDRLEYDLMIRPGADPSLVRLKFAGGRARVAADGAIEIASGGGAVVRQRAPHIYQNSEGGPRRIVSGRFVRASRGEFRLRLGAYERAATLVVDPVLEMSTYLGGDNDDEIVAVVEGAVAGNTRSLSFPGASAELRRTRDVFIRGTGPVIPYVIGRNDFTNTLIIGGDGDDEAAGLTPPRSSFGTLYVAGTTSSADLPVASGKYQGGASDGFVAAVQVSRNYGYLLHARYIGGSGEDRITSFGAADTIYALAGVTDSLDLKVIEGSQRPAGGKDVFYGISESSAENFVFGYLGGSGDDIAYAVSPKRLGTSGYGLWVGGETRSPDFPFENPGLDGASDAFLTDVRLGSVYLQRDLVVLSYRVGGNGEDAIRAIVAAPAAPIVGSGDQVISFRPDLSGAFPVAGSTTSTDLPVRNAMQAAHAGETDGFVGLWTVQSADWRWLTYLGGAGVDVPASMTQNWAGDIYLGGWTTSPALPSVAPLQPASAGGEDGLFAVFDYAGVAKHVSHYGGSGDDRILGIRLVYGLVARIAGVTTSTDLPQRAAWGPRGERTEGFIADIGTDHLVGPSELILPKDGSFAFSVRPSRTGFRVPVTYRSSEPSRVRFSYLGRSVEQYTAAADENVAIEGFADSGEAIVTAEAPGFAPKHIRVRLYRGAIVAVAPVALHTWSEPSTLGVSYRAIDPNTNEPFALYFSTRTGINVSPGRWSVSNPSVATINESGQLIALKAGETVLTLKFDGGFEVRGAERTLVVEKPRFIAPAELRLAKDATSGLPVGFSGAGATVYSRYRGSLTARSTDPSRVLVSSSFSQMGAESATITMANRDAFIYAQALTGEGEARVILTSPEIEGEAVITIRLEPMVVRWGRNAYVDSQSIIEPGVDMYVGASPPSLAISLGTESTLGLSRRPGAPPLVLSLSNTNPRVAGLNRLTIEHGGNETFKITGLEPGEAELRMSISDPSVRLKNETVKVSVRSLDSAASISGVPRSAVSARGLQTPVQFTYTGSDRRVVVTSSDPEALFVSGSSTVRGAADTVVTPTQSSYSYTVYLQAFKSEGEVRVRIRTEEAGEKELVVTLLPAGIGLKEGPSFSSGEFTRRVRVAAYAVDPATRIALGNLLPQPGDGIEVRLRTAGAPIRTSREAVVLTASDPEWEVGFTPPGAGEESELIAEAAPGFDAPARTSRLSVAGAAAPGPTLSIGSLLLSRDEVAPVGFDTTSDAEVTVISGDPSRVLISLGSKIPGEASVKFSGKAQVFVHGIADSGTVPVRFEPTGGAAMELPVAMKPLQVYMEYVEVAPGQTKEVPVRLTLLNELRPGAPAYRIELRPVNPNIATIDPPVIQLGGSERKMSETVRIAGVSPGSTAVLVEGPDNVYRLQSGGTIWVVAPEAPAAPVYRLGKNAQGLLEINLGTSFSNPNGSILTVTSSDPGRVVLSRSATTPGGGSVSLAMQAGTTVTPAFYVQALEQEGDVDLRATVNGVDRKLAVIRLGPAWVACRGSQYGTSEVAVVAGGSMDVFCSVRSEPEVTGSASTGPWFKSMTARAGMQDRPFRLTVSPAGIIEVSPDSLTLGTQGSQSVKVRGLGTGDAVLRVEQPEGFGPAPDGSDSTTARVSLPQLQAGCEELTIGRDMQNTCLLSIPQGVEVTAVSQHPELLLVSNDPAKVGAPNTTITASGGSASITFHALGHFGTAEVVLSAPGYRSRRVAVRLIRPTVAFTSIGYYTTQITIRKGEKQTLAVGIPSSFGSGVRLGSNIVVEVAVNPSGIVEIVPSPVVLNKQNVFVEVRAVGIGATAMRLVAPDGLWASPTPIPVTVIE